MIEVICGLVKEMFKILGAIIQGTPKTIADFCIRVEEGRIRRRNYCNSNGLCPYCGMNHTHNARNRRKAKTRFPVVLKGYCVPCHSIILLCLYLSYDWVYGTHSETVCVLHYLCMKKTTSHSVAGIMIGWLSFLYLIR